MHCAFLGHQLLNFRRCLDLQEARVVLEADKAAAAETLAELDSRRQQAAKENARQAD